VNGSRRVAIEFEAADSGTEPMTWGQLAIWRPVQWYGEQSAYFNMSRVVELGGDLDLPSVCDAIRRLMQSHQSLRARYTDGGAGPRQQVQAGGTIVVRVDDFPAEQAAAMADSVATELGASSFDPVDEWPLRVAIGMVGGVPRFAMFAVSHVAVDWGGLEIVLAEFRALCSPAGTDSAPSWGPLDQARFEQSPRGRRHGEAALDHWRNCLQRTPPSMFDFAPVTPAQHRFQRLGMSSRALAAAAELLATRSRVSTSSVLLAAVSLCLAAVSGRETCALQLIVNNRHDERRRDLVAPVVQNGIFLLEPSASDVAETVSRCYRLGLMAYSCGHYDPDALDAVKGEVASKRGVDFDLTAYFNDVRGGRDRWEGIESEGMSRAGIDALREKTTLTHVGVWETQDCKFFVSVESAPDRALLFLLADTAYLPLPVIEQVLRGVETIVVEAAFRRVPLAEIADLTGLRPPERGAGWEFIRSAWVRPAAVAEVVRKAAGTEQAMVFSRASPAGTGHELEAFVAGASASADLEDLHGKVVAELKGRTDAIAPGLYHRCQRAPAEPGDIRAWLESGLVDSGTGRPPVMRADAAG
jgi:Condensation domain